MIAIGPGTRVRCINDDWGDSERGRDPCPFGPSLGSCWVVKGVRHWAGYRFLKLVGEPRGAFRENHFVPIDDLDDLRELARAAKNPDAPVKPKLEPA